MQAVPDSLIRSLVADYAPRRIILFGSRARGDDRPDSDIDLVLVMDDDAPAEQLRRQRAAGGRGTPQVEIDILPWTERSLREHALAKGSFADTILSEGVIVYQRAPPDRSPIEVSEDPQWANARNWFAKADGDRRMAGLALGASPALIDGAAFHCQQAAEKLLKGLIVSAAAKIPKTHRIEALLPLIAPAYAEIATLAAPLVATSGWSVELRYPDEPGAIGASEEAVRGALATIDALRAAIDALMRHKGVA